MKFLENIDRDLFLFLNGLNSDWIDPFMKIFSAHWFWIPIIGLFIFLAVKKFKKQFWIPIVFLVICFSLTDQTATQTKQAVKRYRPSHNVEIADKVHIVDNYRGGQFGFFSGHAANSFGLAVLTLLFIRKRNYTIFILIWASIVAYSRVYVGVHYPSDVFVGAIVGSAIAFLVYHLHKKIPCFRINSSCYGERL
jgi:undecaprenyl-diphosphatase